LADDWADDGIGKTIGDECRRALHFDKGTVLSPAHLEPQATLQRYRTVPPDFKVTEQSRVL
jgi:hypothetical protein